MPTTSSTSSPSVGRNSKARSEEHTSELQSRLHLVCRLLLEKKKKEISVVDDTLKTDATVDPTHSLVLEIISIFATYSNLICEKLHRARIVQRFKKHETKRV